MDATGVGGEGELMSEPVLVQERRGAVLVLRLNRPDARNALTSELMSLMGNALLEAEESPDIRCVVLTGTGDRAFCAGMDLADFAKGGTPTGDDAQGQEAFGRFASGGSKVPVVGAAQATAVAGGFELLLNCDLVVASETAKFGLPEVKRGLMAAGGGVYLTTRIPPAVALELLLTGDTIEAPRAVALGLVNQVVPADQVVDAAVALAERIAANGPLAVKATREIARAAATDYAGARELMNDWLPKVFGSADATEGATAFIEKRDPVWTGT